MPTSKYDNLVPIERRLPDAVFPHTARLREVASAVRSRCGVDAWVDKWRNELCFGYDRCGDTAIAFAWPVFKHYTSMSPCRFDNTDGVDISVDDICYAISIGRADPAKKSKWLASIKKSAEHDRQERAARTAHETVRHNSQDARRQLQRESMGKHWRGSAVVSGFKE